MQLQRFQDYFAVEAASCFAILLGTSTLACLYNIVHTFMIQEVNAVATTVIGEVKIVALILLSYLMLGDALPVIILVASSAQLSTARSQCAALSLCLSWHARLEQSAYVTSLHSLQWH